MAMCFIQVLLVVVLLQRMLWITSASMNCSCYTFHTDMKTWEKSKEDCTTNNGSLVVMETVEEWKFINSQIQNITVIGVDGSNEWYIGLTGYGKTTEELNGPTQTKSRRDGWTWGNGKKLTIDKWQDRQPNGDMTSGGDACVVMAKNYPSDKYGLFNDLDCRSNKPYICEYSKGSSVKNLVCNNECKSLKTTTLPVAVTTAVTTIPITTRSTVAVTTTDMQATNPATSTSTSVKPVPTSVATSSKPAMTESTTNKQNKVSDVFIALIALAVVLALFICIFIFVFWWMKKKAGKSMSFNKSKATQGAESNTPDLDKIPLNIKNDLNPPPLGVDIVGHDTVIYAEVNNGLKPPPVPVFVDVSDYAEPVDSINTDNLYASVVDNQTQEKAKNENTSQINADNVNESKNNDQPESENMAAYAVVDKSKKTKKEDDLYASVDDNHAQERGRFHMNGGVDTVKIENNADMDTVNVNHTNEEFKNMAYAVVDKSNKTKKEDDLYASVDDNHAQEREFHMNGGVDAVKIENNADMDAVNHTDEEPENMAVYAVVDKSKKTKKQENDLEAMYAQVDKSKKTKNRTYDNVENV